MLKKNFILGILFVFVIFVGLIGCGSVTSSQKSSKSNSSSKAVYDEVMRIGHGNKDDVTVDDNSPKDFIIKDEIANGSIEDLKIQICDDIILLGSMFTVKEFFELYPDYRFAKKNGDSIIVKKEKTDEFCVHDKVEVQNDKLGTSFSLYVLHPGLDDVSIMDCSVVTVMDLNNSAKAYSWYSGGYKYNEPINDDSLFDGYSKVDFWKDKVTIGTYSGNSGANHHIVEGKNVNIYGVKPVFQIAISQTGHRLKDLIVPYYANIKAYVTKELQNRYLNVLRDKD